MIKFIDWNLIEYSEAWKKQQEVFDAMIALKMDKKPTEELQQIVYCEHPHVYTLGKHGNPNEFFNFFLFLQFLSSVSFS